MCVLVYGSEKIPDDTGEEKGQDSYFRKIRNGIVYNERYARRSNVVELFPTLWEAIVDTFFVIPVNFMGNVLFIIFGELWLCFGAAAVIGAERTTSYSCCGSIDRCFQR